MKRVRVVVATFVGLLSWIGSCVGLVWFYTHQFEIATAENAQYVFSGETWKCIVFMVTGIFGYLAGMVAYHELESRSIESRRAQKLLEDFDQALKDPQR